MIEDLAGTAECPMCSTDFEPESCHAACPFSSGCGMSRCPRCGYEFIVGGRIASILQRFLQGRSHDSRGNG